jgi:hypothetical protein
MRATMGQGNLLPMMQWFSLLGFAAPVFGLSITNLPFADTSLIEAAADNSNGGQEFVLAGRTQSNSRVRALYRFDLGALPTNSVILSATVQLDCIRRSSEPMCVADVSFELHRLMRAWGEGTNVADVNPGLGSPASPGDATWNHAFFPTNAWSVPGGQAGVDFSAVGSSFQFITTPSASPYRFESTPEMVDDVQAWVRTPAQNFGWMLIANPEDTPCTARRFNSREDSNSQPLLEIEYRVPPRFDLAQWTGNQFQMRFTPWPGQSYAIEYRSALTNSGWQTLTNPGVLTNASAILISDTPLAEQRYYRVTAH